MFDFGELVQRLRATPRGASYTPRISGPDMDEHCLEMRTGDEKYTVVDGLDDFDDKGIPELIRYVLNNSHEIADALSRKPPPSEEGG